MTEHPVEEKILNEAEKLCEQTIRPNVNRFEKNNGVSKDVIQQLAAHGFLAAPLPEKYGGLGLNAVAYGHFTEIIGKACVATRSLITVHSSLVGMTILRFGTDDQKNKWLKRLSSGEWLGAFALTEAQAGSDVKNIQTSWHEENGDYVLN